MRTILGPRGREGREGFPVGESVMVGLVVAAVVVAAHPKVALVFFAAVLVM